jgi:hypothetical protein
MKTTNLTFLAVAALYIQPTSALAFSTIQTVLSPHIDESSGVLLRTLRTSIPQFSVLPTASTLPPESLREIGGGKSIGRRRKLRNLGSPSDGFTHGRRAALSFISAVITALMVSPTIDAKQQDEESHLGCDASASKMFNLSNRELANIIMRDCQEKRFLFTGDMTRSIYDENARFKDGSDIDGAYSMNAWSRGCKFLFDENESQCSIREDTLSVTSSHVKFRFTSVLQFRHFFRPKVSISGTIVMKRDVDTGLILSYEEKWDRSVGELLETFIKWPMWGR